MPGQPDRFVIDALHQAAIARDHPGAVIDQIVAEHRVQMPFRHRHADRHCDTLPQRPGGAFHPVEQEILRVTRAGAGKLTEALDVVHRRRSIAGEVQQAVDQHRTVARAQHETIAIRPVRRGWIKLQMAGEQYRRRIGHAHRHPRMARIGGLNRVHRQGADRIGHRLKADGVKAHGHAILLRECPRGCARFDPGCGAVCHCRAVR